MFSTMNKSINNLKEALADFLECQLESPDAVFSISEDSYMLDESLEEVRVEGDVLFDVVSSITNCCYSPDGGEELFPSDGKPQLIMKLEFYDVYNNEDMERLQKIQSLPIYKKFTHLKIDPENRPFEHWLCVDCGEDVDAMVEICQSLIEDVYAIRVTQEWDFLVLETDTKKIVQKNIKKRAERPLVVTKIQ